MFSEYASRFLAQSQSRLSLSQNDPNNSNRNTQERQRGGLSRGPARGYLQRRPYGNPYAGGTASQTSRFPFATRASQSQAPLFYSATDEFREEDDGQEHEREAADFYALQQSRRDFGAEQLSESSEDGSRDEGMWGPAANTSAGPRGIRSSWTGDEQDEQSAAQEQAQKKTSEERPSSAIGSFLSRAKDRLVDVELASTIHEADEMEAGQSRSAEADMNPPSIQQIRKPMTGQMSYRDGDLDQSESAPFLRQQQQRASSLDEESVPALAGAAMPRQDAYDSFWGSLFLINMVALLSTFILIVLHTSAPGNSSRLGDTIYSTMTSSFYLLAVDTLVAVIVALVWIAALRSFVRPLVYLMLLTVPVVAVAFSLYPFISSFGGSWQGHSIQDQVMRWASFLPGAFAVVWVYTAYKGRGSLERAISLLEFTTRIVAACPTLIAVGFATLGAIVLWTWVWMLMFTRVFLGGHRGTAGLLFIIDTSTWWLGAYFFLTYLWSLGVLSGVQRATTAATTSQWYFYRNAVPAPPAHSVVRAAFLHATSKVFGTICLSTLLALAVRLPLLVLPARLSGYLSLCMYSFVPASVTTLTNPLTLTYAAIHSQPLGLAARGLSELTFVAPAGTGATTALTPGAFASPRRGGAAAATGTPSLVAYRLAKLLLHATRLATSLGFGFGGWVSTARGLAGADGAARGSLYAYVVGLIAGAIGWAVLGAAEGILGGVLDSVVICWGSEMQSHGSGQARFCREAGELLADDGRVGL